MDSLHHLNQAMHYIEDHLTEQTDYAQIARIAGCSEYHFKRMFSFLTGVSLSEYIRRRRLTLAVLDLKDPKVRILDVALRYGYDSADSFARAFYALHGILPSGARQEKAKVKAYPRMSFQITIKGATVLNYRIVEKGPFYIIGLKQRVPIVFSGVNPSIAAMAEQFTAEDIGKLKAISDGEPKGIIQASINFSEQRMQEQGELDHYIGVATSSDELNGFEVLKVGAGTWAVFEAVGPFPDALQEVWGRVYSEWFPSSGFEAAPGPEMLWNESPDTTDPNHKSAIWIPVQKTAVGK